MLEGAQLRMLGQTCKLKEADGILYSINEFLFMLRQLWVIKI
jgi:hypothetical protein